MKIQFEYTDTYGGEANYSWVKRTTKEYPEDVSDRTLSRDAKAWADITGIPCRREDLGDLVALYPQACCTVLFITTLES